MYFVYIGSCIQYLKGLKQEVLEEIPFLTELLGGLTIEVYIFTFHHIHYECEPDFFLIWLLKYKRKVYLTKNFHCFGTFKKDMNN
jgi:hypothetical protein